MLPSRFIAAESVLRGVTDDFKTSYKEVQKIDSKGISYAGKRIGI